MDIIKLDIPPDISNYAGLVRYILNNHDMSATTANSFLRLLKDSKYDEINHRFIFHSVHPHYTEPRLDQISRSIGLLWTRITQEPSYQCEYRWLPTDIRLGNAIIELKRKKDPFYDIIH